MWHALHAVTDRLAPKNEFPRAEKEGKSGVRELLWEKL